MRTAEPPKVGEPIPTPPAGLWHWLAGAFIRYRSFVLRLHYGHVMHLACPTCTYGGAVNTVLVRDGAAAGRGHEAVAVQPDRGVAAPGYVQVDLRCSAGHAFALMSGNLGDREVLTLGHRP